MDRGRMKYWYGPPGLTSLTVPKKGSIVLRKMYISFQIVMSMHAVWYEGNQKRIIKIIFERIKNFLHVKHCETKDDLEP